MSGNTEIPDGAKITDDLDCVVLSSPPSFFSQVVRLAVAEKGCKYKYFTVDHRLNEHMQPWYVNLNPGAWVPTIIVAGNKPVCESTDIVHYVDEHFKGERQLNKEIMESAEVKGRYVEFMRQYEDSMVEPFSFGTICSKPVGQFMPLAWFLSTIRVRKQSENDENSPQLKEIYKKKLVSKAEQARVWLLGQPKSFEQATKKLVNLSDTVEKWMSENNSEWALGTREYSTADIFFTVYLHRIAMNKEVLAREIMSRPNLARYFTKVQNRPTSKIANVNTINFPPNAAIWMVMGVIVAVLNGLFYLGLKLLGVKVNGGNALQWFGGFSVSFITAVKVILCYYRRKLIAFCDEMANVSSYVPPTAPS